MKFKVARADRGWKIFVGGARASPGGRQFAKRISACGPSQDGPWVSWPQLGYLAFSALLSPHHLRIGNLLANFVQCLVPFQRPRLPLCGSILRSETFPGVTSTTVKFESLRRSLRLSPPSPPKIHRFVNRRSDCLWFELHARVDAFDQTLFSCTIIIR